MGNHSAECGYWEILTVLRPAARPVAAHVQLRDDAFGVQDVPHRVAGQGQGEGEKKSTRGLRCGVRGVREGGAQLFKVFPRARGSFFVSGFGCFRLADADCTQGNLPQRPRRLTRVVLRGGFPPITRRRFVFVPSQKLIHRNRRDPRVLPAQGTPAGRVFVAVLARPAKRFANFFGSRLRVRLVSVSQTIGGFKRNAHPGCHTVRSPAAPASPNRLLRGHHLDSFSHPRRDLRAVEALSRGEREGRFGERDVGEPPRVPSPWVALQIHRFHSVASLPKRPFQLRFRDALIKHHENAFLRAGRAATFARGGNPAGGDLVAARAGRRGERIHRAPGNRSGRQRRGRHWHRLVRMRRVTRKQMLRGDVWTERLNWKRGMARRVAWRRRVRRRRRRGCGVRPARLIRRAVVAK